MGDALQWMMLEEGTSWVGHYLDDFITVVRRMPGKHDNYGWSARAKGLVFPIEICVIYSDI